MTASERRELIAEVKGDHQQRALNKRELALVFGITSTTLTRALKITLIENVFAHWQQHGVENFSHKRFMYVVWLCLLSFLREEVWPVILKECFFNSPGKKKRVFECFCCRKALGYAVSGTAVPCCEHCHDCGRIRDFCCTVCNIHERGEVPSDWRYRLVVLLCKLTL
jgi:hypothetical protein